DIAGRVIESAVTLTDDARLVCQLRNVAEEDNRRAFADLRNFRSEQAIDHASQSVIIKTFAALDVVLNIEQFINVLEILHRKRNALVPNVGILFVAGLKLD